MRFIKGFLIAALAVFLFPFLLRTVGLFLAVAIAFAIPALIMAISYRFPVDSDEDEVEKYKQARTHRSLQTEIAKEEGFTEEELRALRERNRHR